MERIINEQYERAKDILKKYAKEHNEIRDLLIKREVIYNDDVEVILGPRPWKSRDEDPNVKAHQQKMLSSESAFKNADSAEDTPKNEEPEQEAQESEVKSLPDTLTAGQDTDEDAGTPPPFNK